MCVYVRIYIYVYILTGNIIIYNIHVRASTSYIIYMCGTHNTGGARDLRDIKILSGVQ